jgi:hypothetical protein
MGVLPAVVLAAALVPGTSPVPTNATRPAHPLPDGELSAEDARYLDYLVEWFLFDPAHATRVRVPIPFSGTQRGPDSFTEDRDGWLVRGTDGRPDRICFTDGESMPVPAVGVRQLDFEAECERWYDPDRWRAKHPGPDRTARLPMAQSLKPIENDLVDAAWLHRRGYDGLAARALAASRVGAPDDPLHDMRARLARWAGHGLINAFGRRADSEARIHADRLTRLYPDLVPPQAAVVLADLDRRQRADTLGRPAPGWPPGFHAWNDSRKVAYLIDTLDEIAGRPGADSDPTEHPRVRALIELGDAAVPALLLAAERDDRLTRFVEHQQSPVDRDEQPVEVREVARQSVRRILRVSHLDPHAPEDADDNLSPLARLRQYWAMYGHLPFPDRMITILTDAGAQPHARAEAAEFLASYVPPGRSSWGRHPVPGRPGPMADRPAVGDAILAALDSERERGGRRRRPTSVEGSYLRSLVKLGDRRTGPELARRSQEEAAVRARVVYADAAHRLGESGPLLTLARELADGAVPLGPQRGGYRSSRAVPDSLAELFRALVQCGLPEAEEALYALADQGHPYRGPVLRDLLASNRPGEFPWAYHPFSVAVLRTALTDPRPTRTHYYLRGDEFEIMGPGKMIRHALPPGATGWHEHVEERVCDEAATWLAELVVGVPEPNPLRPDADAVLADMRTSLLRYERRLRLLTFNDQMRLGVRRIEPAFLPDIRPLGRPATAADVREGWAVFELNGNGRVSDVALPAWILFKSEANEAFPAWGLAVQAEVGPHGAVMYGVIDRHAIRAVKADEVERIEPYEGR